MLHGTCSGQSPARTCRESLRLTFTSPQPRAVDGRVLASLMTDKWEAARLAPLEGKVGSDRALTKALPRPPGTKRTPESDGRMLVKRKQTQVGSAAGGPSARSPPGAWPERTCRMRSAGGWYDSAWSYFLRVRKLSAPHARTRAHTHTHTHEM